MSSSDCDIQSRVYMTCMPPENAKFVYTVRYSRCGQRIFILYVNDICNISKILKFVLFADDTNIFCSGHDAMQLSRDLSNGLDKLSVWFAANKLILNVSKTNFMVFGNSKQRNTILQVSINQSFYLQTQMYHNGHMQYRDP